MKTNPFPTLLLLFLLLSTGCGTEEHSGNTEKENNEPPLTGTTLSSPSNRKEASAFLSRATFGARMEDIEALMKLGSYDRWIEKQFKEPPSFHISWAEEKLKGIDGIGDLKDNPEDWRRYSDALGHMQRDAWWDIVVNGKDQLRQRVAFALSEIFVVSRYGPLVNSPDTRMSYYDTLVKNAFGNFETLLREITYHPAMGRYLSYLGNAKSNPETGSHPDENYAREVMQLFTIGLYQLNRNGSHKLDDKGNPIPTYTQKDVEQLARVFTGLSDQNGFFFPGEGDSTHHSRTRPMIPYEEYHDTGEKKIMDLTIPAGGSTRADIDMALEYLANHPNTGPFIARRLIQRLVTSNPSPEYIERVADAFADNGRGERGDMKAVIRAVLLDEEALEGSHANPATFGKVREPLLFVSHLLRAFHAKKSENILYQGEQALYRYASYGFNGTGYTRQEGPLEALTVFNYFSPDNAPYILKKEGLVAPEFELFGTAGIHEQLAGLINRDTFIYETHGVTAELQLDAETRLLESGKEEELLNRLDVLLSSGNLSTSTRRAILDYMERYKAMLPADTLVRHAITLVMTSPDYAVQR